MKHKLHCYSSGDGALHFTWLDDKGCASGKKVTGAQAKQFLARKSEDHLRLAGYFPMQEHGTGPYWCLVHRVERTGPNTLRMLMWHNGDKPNSLHEYTYEQDKTDWAWNHEHKQCRSVALKVTTPCEAMPSGIIEVLNWSVLHCIAYFLTHEEQITKWLADHPQPPLESLLVANTDAFVGAGI